MLPARDSVSLCNLWKWIKGLQCMILVLSKLLRTLD